MRIFALETSTERLSLALFADGARRVRDIDAGQQHSDLALPLIRELFAEANLSIQDLDAIAYGQGPGSFTGVRIACGVAQGMSYGAGLGMIPVETQMALAESCENDRIIVALDARMGEIYLAAYERDDAQPTGWLPRISPMLTKPDSLPAISGNTWFLTGSALRQRVLAEALMRQYGGCVATSDPGNLPKAAAVAIIAARILQRSGKDALLHPRDAAPLYLRDRVALTTEERAAAKAAA